MKRASYHTLSSALRPPYAHDMLRHRFTGLLYGAEESHAAARALNSHDALVEALHDIDMVMESLCGSGLEDWRALAHLMRNKARAALRSVAATEGQS